MERLSVCDSCGANVFAGDVFKTVAIPKAPNYVALVYRCGNCKIVGKMSCELADWINLRDDHEDMNLKNQLVIKEAEIELDAEWTVELIQSYWRSLHSPPKLERGKYDGGSKKHS